MNVEKNGPRILGATFLIVIVTSAIAGTSLDSAIGTGNISNVLRNIPNNLPMMHFSILGGMLNSVGIIFLAVLLYIVLKKQSKILALAALSLWLAEAVFYAIMQIGSLALISLSVDFVKAGAPMNSFYQTMGEFLYTGVYRHGLMIHMWFYCVGGLLWYSLFFKSKYIPRVISLFGVIAVIVGLAGIVVEFFGSAVPIIVYLPIGLFEFIIGFWLSLKGITVCSEKIES